MTLYSQIQLLRAPSVTGFQLFALQHKDIGNLNPNGMPHMDWTGYMQNMIRTENFNRYFWWKAKPTLLSSREGR